MRQRENVEWFLALTWLGCVAEAEAELVVRSLNSRLLDKIEQAFLALVQGCGE